MGAADQMLMMMLTLARKREYVTQTFYSNTTWPAPAGIIQVVSLVAKGQDGTSTYYEYTDPDVTTYTMKKLTQITYPDGSSNTFVSDSYPTTAGAAVPNSYCENARPTGERYCYSYLKETTVTPGTTHSGYNTTTGAATTAFGYTFAGGVSTAATPGSQANIATVPGSNYNFVIPTGGYVTITY